ncbi:MAG: transcriptional repressor [Crocinitomicaceae bacterium]|nr:transcriptional repressor [Crocinitomicaceae bacterium]
MENLLRNKKLSETPFRKEVLAILSKYSNAIPLSRIERELKNYNRITLYRTIKTFIDKGVIHEITISGEESNFAVCKEECGVAKHQHQHIHFKCDKCDIVFCVEMDKYPTITIPDYTISQLEIQASGLCKECN